MARNTVNISITIDKDFLKEVDAFAKSRKSNRSKEFSIAIKKRIEEEDKYNYEKIIQQHDG